MQLLLPGEDIKFSDPADVGGSYEAFQYRTLLACCAAMGTGALARCILRGILRRRHAGSSSPLRARLTRFETSSRR
jgi:hypothetical protein